MAATTSKELREKKCSACEGETEPLDLQESRRLVAEVPGWKLSGDAKSIRRDWKAADFMTAIEFFDRVAKLAEADNHHPDLHLTGYRNVAIELSTHAIGGLSENDFILAAKINELPIRLKDR